MLLKMENSRTNDALNQDPDYSVVFNTNTNHQNVFEDNARSNTAKKISTIIEAEFLKEINNKKEEIFHIYKNLNKACKMLHYLRFAIVTDFYNQENTINNDNQVKQTRLHPTVNCPVGEVPIVNPNHDNNCLKEIIEHNKLKRKNNNNDECDEPQKKKLQHSLQENDKVGIMGLNGKTKRRIIVGNLSKWIPPDFRDSDATHKWTVYIRDSEKCDLGQLVSKVRFFLHPSYKPNDVIELTSPPFILCRHGWGEFPIRVQLHFVNSFNKPVDIIHNLKLDRTFTGLQTIGSETVVDIWITMKGIRQITNVEESKNSILNTASSTHEKDTNSNNLIQEKNKNTNSLIKEKIENSHTTVICQSFIDHDYLGIYSKYIANTSSSQKSQLFEDDKLIVSQNSIVKSDENKKSRSLIKTCFANHKVSPKTNSKQISLLKKSYISGDHGTSTSTKYVTCRNLSTNSECIKKSLNNCDGDNTKVYFKCDSHVNDIEDSKVLINIIEKAQPKSLFDMLKFITKRMPLITEKAVNSVYKVQHPYACETYQLFSNFSRGKRKALERYRAICVLDIVGKTKRYKNSWNIKEFMIWARRYSYTPLLNLKDIQKVCEPSESIDIDHDYKKYDYTSTISTELNKWLLQCQKVKPSIVNFQIESDDEIDILNIPSNSSRALLTCHDSKVKNNSVIIMDYPKEQDSLQEFVCKSTQQIGIKLVNEEIINGISHSTASLLMTEAVKCLMEDLLRLSFSCALDRCKSQSDEVLIKPNDIRMALLKKEELEIFTNVGLGSEG